MLSISSRSQWLYFTALAAAAIIIASALHTDAIATKELVSPLLVLFSTFFGATFAFRLNEEKEKRKLLNSQREALNRALFVLARQTNAIHQLKKDFEKFPAPFLKAFNLPALKPPAYSDLVHSLADLDFLLDSTEPGLLMQLAIEQERFHQALESLRIRNDFYVGEVQPAMSKLGLNGKTISMEQAADLLGEYLFRGAMSGADIAWQHISSCADSIPDAHQALWKQAKALYPDRKFLLYQSPA